MTPLAARKRERVRSVSRRPPTCSSSLLMPERIDPRCFSVRSGTGVCCLSDGARYGFWSRDALGYVAVMRRYRPAARLDTGRTADCTAYSTRGRCFDGHGSRVAAGYSRVTKPGGMLSMRVIPDTKSSSTSVSTSRGDDPITGCPSVGIRSIFSCQALILKPTISLQHEPSLSMTCHWGRWGGSSQDSPLDPREEKHRPRIDSATKQ